MMVGTELTTQDKHENHRLSRIERDLRQEPTRIFTATKSQNAQWLCDLMLGAYFMGVRQIDVRGQDMGYTFN